MTELSITRGKGIHLRFDNGLLLSVQVGGGNYCDNYDHEIGSERKVDPPASSTAEIAVWQTLPTEHGMFQLEGDTVKGWVSINDVLRFAAFLAAMPEGVGENSWSERYADFEWSTSTR